MLSALVSDGIEGGYLANPRLAKVRWQAGDRPLPSPAVTVAGESAQRVDLTEIPSRGDIGGLGRALAAGRHAGTAVRPRETACLRRLRSRAIESPGRKQPR